jgi:mono/diheme cytochrome c family protein
MVKRVLVLLAILTLSGVVAVSAQKPKIEKESIRPTSAANGKEMFTSYCAACHGVSGKGDGPAASALKKTPADLTKISARHGGKFPSVEVSRYIEGADEIAAHGSRDMPVWGELFRSLNGGIDNSTAMLRVNALTTYLQGIQQ